MDLKLRCSSSGCLCIHFVTSKDNLRVCDGCSHSWLAHLFEKLLRNDEMLSVFDVCSLALYGTHALPIRLKIVIERLLSTVDSEETDKILQSFGWSAADLARGYMIHGEDGSFLTKWSILPRDEEPLVLEQFLRFPSTHSLTFALLRKELPAQAAVAATTDNKEVKSSNSPIHFNNNNNHLKQQDRSQSVLNLSASASGPSSASESSLAGSCTASVPPSEDDDDDEEDDDDMGIMLDEDGTPAVETNEADENSTSSYCGPEQLATGGGAVDLSSNSKSTMESLSPQSSSASNELPSMLLAPSPPSSTRTGSNSGRPGRKPTRKIAEYGNRSPKNAAWAQAAIAASVTVNPATGKRRVLCSVCQKTFCDKGALKIHFSAVHLREMHKCTVNGCTMMFSSRRSRNRHSANPNPKLHSPHVRRKISPNDGRSAERKSGSNASSISSVQGVNSNRNNNHHHRQNQHNHQQQQLVMPRYSPPATAMSHLLGLGIGTGAPFGMIPSLNEQNSSSFDRNTNSTVDELLRKNGARKRKLTNPIRAIQLDYNSSPNEMKQSMELFKAKEDKEDRKKKRAPAAEEEDLGMDLTNEILANNPLQALASKVFQFNPHFQNLQFNVMTEKLYESLFSKRQLEYLFEKNSFNKLNNNVDEEEDEEKDKRTSTRKNGTVEEDTKA